MFSIANYIYQSKTESRNDTAVFTAAFVDFTGALALLALGILANGGQGNALINSLNTISDVSCGGGLMIAGSVVTMAITSVFAAKSRDRIRLPKNFELPSEEGDSGEPRSDELTEFSEGLPNQ